MKITNTAQRIKWIMDSRHLKQVDILEMAKPFCEKYEVKLSKSDLSQFISGKVEPGSFKLTIIGLALNVSETWLMGYDVPMDRGQIVTEKPTTVSDDGLASVDINLLKSLSKADLDIVLSLARQMKLKEIELGK